jgi:hypothetical protein
MVGFARRNATRSENEIVARCRHPQCIGDEYRFVGEDAVIADLASKAAEAA